MMITLYLLWIVDAIDQIEVTSIPNLAEFGLVGALFILSLVFFGRWLLKYQAQEFEVRMERIKQEGEENLERVRRDVELEKRHQDFVEKIVIEKIDAAERNIMAKLDVIVRSQKHIQRDTSLLKRACGKSTGEWEALGD